MAEVIEDKPQQINKHLEKATELAFNIVEMLIADGVVLSDKEKRIHESYRNNQQK